MRVLVSSYQCVPNEGSELGNGWNWARALADEGHDVTIVTQESQRGLAPLPTDIEIVYVPPSISAVQRAAGRLGSVGRQVYSVSYYLRWQDAAAEYMQHQHRGAFDVVHHVAWGSIHLGTRLWRLGVPLVYGPTGGGQVAPQEYRRYFGGDWPAERLRTLATRPTALRLNPRSRETIRNAAVVLTTNSATSQACQALGGRDVRYMLDSGIPPSWLAERRTRPGGTPIVLWVGRFLARKAPALAVEAFAELRGMTAARLVMAGDGPLLDETMALVSRLGLDDDVEFLGRVPWSDVVGLYDAATVFLFTSLRESFGSQFLEALGRGLPAVALNHHGVGDADVGQAAVKVGLTRDPADLPGPLGAALHTLATGEGWDERSAAAVAWASQHTWPAKAAQATKVFADVLSTRP